MRKIPKKFLKTKDKTNWKPCLSCGGEIVQVRKALFTCLKCNKKYISSEEDMEL